ncbi:MAG: hypothetical protein ACREOO_15580 [bacterium]
MSDNRPGGAPPHVSLLASKLYLPPARSDLVPRPRLTERLNESLQRQLWIPRSPRSVTWVSLDKGDNEYNSSIDE